MPLNFHHLRYFHAVVQAGTLTKAAQKLNVAPSALSVQVQQLEAQLGHQLFERRGRQLLLTEAGRMVYDRADAIFDASEELLAALKGAKPTQIVLRIGALATLSRNLQAAFMRPVLGRQDVRIVLRSATMRELMALLAGHQLDVLLTNTLPLRDEAAGWTPHLIADQLISLVGRPRAGPAKVETLLASEPLIVPTPENHLRGQFDALIERLGLKPRIAAEVDDMALLRLLAAQGFGVAAAPPIVVRDELAAGALVEFGPLPGLRETFFAITPNRRFPNPLVDDLLRAAAHLGPGG